MTPPKKDPPKAPPKNPASVPPGGAPALLVEAMRRIEAIPKNARNIQSGYAARSIDDVYNHVHGVLADVGLVVIPYVIEIDYETTVNDKKKVVTDARLLIEYRFLAADGSAVVARVAAEGRDWADKATSKASSMALKTGLLQTFLIPLDADPDSESPEIDRPDETNWEWVAKDAVLSAAGGDKDRAAVFWDAIMADLKLDRESAIDKTLASKIVAEAHAYAERPFEEPAK